MTAGDFKNGTNLEAGFATPAFIPAAETTLYTAPALSHVKLGKPVICNTSASAVTVSVSRVPSGGTAGDVNRVIKSWSLGAAGTDTSSLEVSELTGTVLGPGCFISAIASTAGVLAFTLDRVVSA